MVIDVPPVAQHYRRIPFHQRHKVTSALIELEKNDVIERVDGPPTWVSPIVVVPKPQHPGEVIDLRLGYHQLVLAEESRYITTFSRYKRLNFGISSASEVFQNAIANAIDCIDGALNMSDDIFMFGKGRSDSEALKEHDRYLSQVLQRLQESGVTANLPKCEF